MSIARDTFHELTHQLQFLLFEIGLGLSEQHVKDAITATHQDLIAQNITTSFDALGKHSLARIYKSLWHDRLRVACRHHDSLWHWLTDTHTPAQVFDFLNQFGCRPDVLSNDALSFRETLQYSACFQAKVNLQWCALHRSLADTRALERDYHQFINHHFPRQTLCWQEKLKLRHKLPRDYCVLPIHPWQYRHKVQKSAAQLIDDGLIVPLLCHKQALPGLSADTFFTDKGPILTLRLDEAHHDVTDAANQAYFNQAVIPTSSLASIRFTSHTFSLSATFTNNPVEELGVNEVVMPLAALKTHSPVSNKPLMLEIARQGRLSPTAFFSALLEQLLSPLLPAYLDGYCVNEQDISHAHLILRQDAPYGLQMAPTEKHHLDAATARQHFVETVIADTVASWIETLTSHTSLAKADWWSLVHAEITRQFDTLHHNMNKDFLKQESRALNELITSRITP